MTEEDRPDPALYERACGHLGGATINRILRMAVASPAQKGYVLLRQMGMVGLFTGLRAQSELHMDTFAMHVARKQQALTIVKYNPNLHSVGDRVDVRCYPGDDWVVEVTHRLEEQRALPPERPAEPARKTSAGALPPTRTRG